MTYIFYLILNLIATVVCYVTNPIVVLFATELGELKGFLKYWQTWDDSLDPRFFVMEKVPKIFRYDYDKHYTEYEGTTPELEAVGRMRWFVKFVEGGENFSIKERIQRYFCRVFWLTRNNSYGFSFWLFGRTINPKDMIWNNVSNDTKFGYDKSESFITRAWTYKSEAKIFSWVRWEIYLGWKISEDSQTIQQCMIANRIAIRFIKD